MTDADKPVHQGVRQRSKRKLIDAARTLFTQHGYDGTSMQMIVKLAGTSVGNTYFYFKNKEELLESVVLDTLIPRKVFTESVMVRFQQPVERIAVSVYLVGLQGFKGLWPELGGRERNIDEAVLAMFERTLGRWHLQLLQKSFPKSDMNDLGLTAQANQGSLRNMIYAFLSGQIEGEPEYLAKQATMRVLRIAGFSPDEIAEGMNAITTMYAMPDWEPDLFSPVFQSESSVKDNLESNYAV